jgi:DMSO reductase anchor subunit
MQPAYSVIVFTTASGAGYGLLIGLSAAAALGLVPHDRWLGVFGLGTALVLVTVGLLTSTFHLGRPERAWRGLTQWQTSWLSREGIVAILTYVPAGMMGLGWVFGEIVPGQIVGAAWLSIAGAFVTLWCTGMIYASLPTIRAWHQPLVPPIYLVMAMATGALLLCLFLAIFGYQPRWAAAIAVLALAAGWILKFRYWWTIDRETRSRTAEAATGLGHLGTVRPLDPPHTQPNFVMREMGYQVARRHAEMLRWLAMILLFALPIVASLLLLLNLSPPLQIAIALLSVVSAGIGVLTERWLFFAEAEHVVVLYYRGGVA